MIRRLGFRGSPTDLDCLAESLAGAGLSAESAAAKSRLFADAATALGEKPSSGFFVPGRIEVLGKHTDYAGGRSIVAAAERGFCVVAAPRDDDVIRVVDAVRPEETLLQVDPDLVPNAGHWSNYPMTVARRLAQNFPAARQGVEIAFASDLPRAAGMSSSSVLMIAIALVLIERNGLYSAPQWTANIGSLTDLAGYLATIENGQTFGSLAGDRGVGTFGGSEDHTAILTCRAGYLSQYAYAPVRFEREIAVPPGVVFAIGSSGVVAAKTGAAMEKYNAASRLAAEVAALWRSQSGRNDPHIAAAIASSATAAGQLEQFVRESGSPSLVARLAHFLEEDQAIIPAAGDALTCGDLANFGRLVDRSQWAAEQLLGNQVPETIHLAQAARQHGALAASAFGAGFGGSVWALVESSAANDFLSRWSDAYRRRYPHAASHAAFFLTAPGPAALQVF